MNGRFRLAVHLGDWTQPLSLMRGLGPFSAMEKEDPRFEVVLPPGRPDGVGLDVGWAWLARCDALFYCHPSTDQDLSVLWLARSMGLPIWVEYVDNVFAVEPTNPHWQVVRNRKALREVVEQALAWATVATTVSEQCAEAFPPCAKWLVIPEACLWPAQDAPRRRCITWRGLGSHYQDLAEVMPVLCRVARESPDWEWGLLGEPPEEFVAELSEAAGARSDGSRRVRAAPYFSTPFHAIQAWMGAAPYAHLVPLIRSAFNRAKSDLAWLEASAVGAVVIAPRYLENWRKPGVQSYETVEEFETVLRAVMAGYREGAPHPAVAEARAAIYPGRTLREMNRLRWRAVNMLREAAK